MGKIREGLITERLLALGKLSFWGREYALSCIPTFKGAL
jgi:hypothetical protein